MNSQIEDVQELQAPQEQSEPPRYCKKCGAEKTLTRYTQKKTEKVIKGWKCPSCYNEAQKSRRLAEKKTNPSGRSKTNQKDFERKANWIRTNGNRCNKCDLEFNGHYTKKFNFHHIDPALKNFEIIASQLRTVPEEVVQKELENCILLCGNCHDDVHEDIDTCKITLEESIRTLHILKNEKIKPKVEEPKVIEEKSSWFTRFNNAVQTWYKKKGHGIFHSKSEMVVQLNSQ